VLCKAFSPGDSLQTILWEILARVSGTAMTIDHSLKRREVFARFLGRPRDALAALSAAFRSAVRGWPTLPAKVVTPSSAAEA
jgi:hypothetical protein